MMTKKHTDRPKNPQNPYKLHGIHSTGWNANCPCCPSESIISVEGVGSNPRIETNIGAAYHLQPFRPCAPEFSNLLRVIRDEYSGGSNPPFEALNFTRLAGQ